MDGSDSEGLEHLRDLYTPVDQKLLLPLINSFHSGFFLSLYKTVALSKSCTILNVLAFSV